MFVLCHLVLYSRPCTVLKAIAGGVKTASPVIGSLACQLEVCCTYVIRLLRARADVIIHAFVHSNIGSRLSSQVKPSLALAIKTGCALCWWLVASL